jgi:superfamily II DNA or RNA helicase
LEGGRYKRFSPDLVVVDEAHYGLGEATIEMLDHYRARGAHVVGFTATPHAGADGRSCLDYYGRCPVQ